MVSKVVKKNYRCQGCADKSYEEERTDEEASHSPAEILSQEAPQETGWYRSEGQETC